MNQENPFQVKIIDDQANSLPDALGIKKDRIKAIEEHMSQVSFKLLTSCVKEVDRSVLMVDLTSVCQSLNETAFMMMNLEKVESVIKDPTILLKGILASKLGPTITEGLLRQLKEDKTNKGLMEKLHRYLGVDGPGLFSIIVDLKQKQEGRPADPRKN